jgi:thiol-disulfide isomerase/thioredoxin
VHNIILVQISKFVSYSGPQDNSFFKYSLVRRRSIKSSAQKAVSSSLTFMLSMYRSLPSILQAFIKHSWCGPCHILSPVLERVTADTETQTRSGWPLDLVTVNTEDEDGLSLCKEFKVSNFLAKSGITLDADLSQADSSPPHRDCVSRREACR